MEIDKICICTIHKKETQTHAVDDDNEKLKGKTNTEPSTLTRILRKNNDFFNLRLEGYPEMTDHLLDSLL